MANSQHDDDILSKLRYISPSILPRGSADFKHIKEKDLLKLYGDLLCYYDDSWSWDVKKKSAAFSWRKIIRCFQLLELGHLAKNPEDLQKSSKGNKKLKRVVSALLDKLETKHGPTFYQKNTRNNSSQGQKKKNSTKHEKSSVTWSWSTSNQDQEEKENDSSIMQESKIGHDNQLQDDNINGIFLTKSVTVRDGVFVSGSQIGRTPDRLEADLHKKGGQETDASISNRQVTGTYEEKAVTGSRNDQQSDKRKLDNDDDEDAVVNNAKKLRANYGDNVSSCPTSSIHTSSSISNQEERNSHSLRNTKQNAPIQTCGSSSNQEEMSSDSVRGIMENVQIQSNSSLSNSNQGATCTGDLKETMQNVPDGEATIKNNMEMKGFHSENQNVSSTKRRSDMAGTLGSLASGQDSDVLQRSQTPDFVSAVKDLQGYVCNTNDLQLLKELEHEKRIERLQDGNEKLDKKIDDYSLQKEVLGSQITKIEKDVIVMEKRCADIQSNLEEVLGVESLSLSHNSLESKLKHTQLTAEAQLNYRDKTFQSRIAELEMKKSILEEKLRVQQDKMNQTNSQQQRQMSQLQQSMEEIDSESNSLTASIQSLQGKLTVKNTEIIALRGSFNSLQRNQKIIYDPEKTRMEARLNRLLRRKQLQRQRQELMKHLFG